MRLRDRALTRASLFGAHPWDSSRRICVIGVGDGEDRALRSARNAWFDYHASTLFAAKVGDEHTSTVEIRRPVPGAGAPRADGRGSVRAGLHGSGRRSRRDPQPPEDRRASAGGGLRADADAGQPLRLPSPRDTRRICVGGIGDGHYRTVAAAEQASTKYHTTLLFGAEALVSV